MANIMDDPFTRACFLGSYATGTTRQGDIVFVAERALAIQRERLNNPVNRWLTELEDKNPKAYEALGSADIARLRELLK